MTNTLVVLPTNARVTGEYLTAQIYDPATRSGLLVQGGGALSITAGRDIDAGRGAKTIQAIQPPLIAYDSDGNMRIVPIGPASGSGIATLRSWPDTVPGNADTIAFEGTVDAGDAGIRVSGSLNIAAVRVANADNIQVGGVATGVPVTATPDVGGLTAASNAAGAATKDMDAASSRGRGATNADLPSIITVQVIGYGGGGDDEAPVRPSNDQGNSRQDAQGMTRTARSR